jgi:hypothetical protein
VSGRGEITIHSRGRQWTGPSGASVALDELRRATAGTGGTGRPAHAPPAAGRTDAAAAPPAEQEPVGLLPQVVDRSAAAFDHLEQRDTNGIVAAILAIDRAVVAWSADILQSDDVDRAHSVLRSLVVRLGQAAAVGSTSRSIRHHTLIDNTHRLKGMP